MPSVASIRRSVQRVLYRFSNEYDPQLRIHMAKVYIVLGGAAACAVLGAFPQSFHLVETALFFSFVFAVALQIGRFGRNNFYIRLLMLMVYAFCSGRMLHPGIEYIKSTNPRILVNLLASNIATFIFLTLVALGAQRGQFLMVDGLMTRVANTLAVLSLLNIFSDLMVFRIIQMLAVSYVTNSAVLFDTQNFLEKRRAGDQDVVRHAFDLFFDGLAIFRCYMFSKIQKSFKYRKEEASDMGQLNLTNFIFTVQDLLQNYLF